MTDQEINEAVSRKLGIFQKLEERRDYELANTPRNVGIITCEIIIPDYCHSIEAAWEIVEKHPTCDPEEEEWDFILSHQYNGWLAGWTNHFEEFRFEVMGDTAPMSICLAFLKLP